MEIWKWKDRGCSVLQIFKSKFYDKPFDGESFSEKSSESQTSFIGLLHNRNINFYYDYDC